MRNKVILLTGGTGFVGSYMAHRLLQEGYNIKFLARSSKHQSARERIEKSLRFIDPYHNFRNQYDIIEGDITKSDLRINPSKIQRLKNRIDEVWHCAASISFQTDKRDKTYRVNVEGTENVLEFTTKMQIPRLHYFSTVYVAGNRLSRVYEDELNCGQEFRNPYEQTKFEAEKIVKEWERKNHLRTSIYRLGIVVGDSKSGQTPSFTGYYTLARNFYMLKKMILKRSLKYIKSGVSVRDGFLVLPVMIPCFPQGTVNINTIDYITEIVYHLSQCEESQGKTFHIVNSEPPKVEWLFNTSLEVLGIKRFRLVNVRNSPDFPNSLPGISTNKFLAELEIEILRKCRAYFPYIFGEAVFDDSNVKKLVHVLHPPVTKKLIEILLQYAIKAKFGRHLLE